MVGGKGTQLSGGKPYYLIKEYNMFRPKTAHIDSASDDPTAEDSPTGWSNKCVGYRKWKGIYLFSFKICLTIVDGAIGVGKGPT